MSSGDPHAPDMKKIKREDKDGHVIIKNIFSLIQRVEKEESAHTCTHVTRPMAISVTSFFLILFFSLSPNLLQMSDGERSDQDLVVDDGGDVRDI
jgi:hypothetical protein